MSLTSSLLSKPVTLSWWRVFDSEDDVKDIITAYEKLHPNITIEYRRLRLEEYEQKLLEAMAEDRGPDIFSFHNTWAGKYASRLLPMPPKITLPFQSFQGTLKKELVTELKTTLTPSFASLKDQFVDVVGEDITASVLGLPLALDTLALYANRGLLNQKGIPFPPKTWEEFQEQVIALTSTNAQGEILTAGAALGTALNIPRAFDILSVLMMQNGTEMANASGAVLFNKMPALLSGVKELSPGLEALIFYTNFAKPFKEVYTWDDNMPNALEAFTSGKTAFFFGYAYHRPSILAAAPKMNFIIAPLPQLSSQGEKINYANYWLEGVSQKTLFKEKYAEWAWDFILFATGEKNVVSYLNKVKKPAALRGLLPLQESDPDLKVFSSQAFTAKSWYRGKNPLAAEQAFLQTIGLSQGEGQELSQALEIGASKVQESY